ncbi:MAG: hypothetical protein K2X00_16855 [Nitrospiraceae bacterium]|nr:hypothetical protein [Nitrospiraceae bacterium]
MSKDKKFVVTQYIDELQGKLAVVSRHAKVAFAIWCAQHLVESIQIVLQELGEIETIFEAIKFVKRAEDPDGQVDEESFLLFTSHLEGFDFTGLGLSPSTKFGFDVVTIEAVTAVLFALQVCKNDSAECAARCAECVLNSYDRVLSERLRVHSNSQEVFEDPSMKAEIARQNDAIVLLCRTPVPSSALPIRSRLRFVSAGI